MICPKRCSCSGVSRSRSEPLETKPRRSHSCFYCLRNDHTVITVLVDAQFLGLFSLPDVRHLAATVAPLSHDNCCQSDFLLWLIFFWGGVGRGGLFPVFSLQVASVTSHVRELLTRVKGGAFQTSKVRSGCLSNPDQSTTTV